MLDYSEAEFDRIVDLNVRGTFFFLREVGRIRVEQKSGSIIASSSIRAFMIEPGLAVAIDFPPKKRARLPGLDCTCFDSISRAA